MSENEGAPQEDSKASKRLMKIEAENEELRKALKRSEAQCERYRGLYEFLPVGYLTLDEKRTIQEINPSGAALLGKERRFILGQNITQFIDPEFQDTLCHHLERMLTATHKESCEVRLLRQDQVEPFVQIRCAVEVDEKGKVKELRLTITDISERKRTEEWINILNEDLKDRMRERTKQLQKAEGDIRALAHQIISAQEEERQMIARELHDTLAQDLSYVRMVLRSLPGQEEPGWFAEKEVRQLCDVLEKDIARVRNLSYDLGTPGLRGRGLVTALSNYCKEFSARSGLQLQFDAIGLDQTKISYDTGKNLYRLVQEGLNNILKHAKATHAFVRLLGTFPDVILTIIDNGHGFDVKARLEALTSEKRMGLRSMQERVNLLRGKMWVRSRVGVGTQISIRVPCVEEKKHGS